MIQPPTPPIRRKRSRISVLAQIAIPLAIGVIPKLIPDHANAAATTIVVQAPAQVATVAVPPAPASMAAASPAPLPAATPACQQAFLQPFQAMGLPYQRGDDAAANETLVCRRGYALGYDATTHDPNWVVEHLTPADLRGTAVRSNKFTQDPSLGTRDANNNDYAKSGFDRGHQAPAGDAKFDQAVMDQSFYFSNMAPQVGIGFNRGVWKYLEESVRAWVLCGGHQQLYVITGPIQAGAGHAPIGADQVKVPSAFFKIVYDPGSHRAVGFVLPNQKIGSTIANLQTYVVPISQIETDTRLAFFRSLDLRTQALLKQQAGTAWGHVGTCSGDGGD